MAAFRAGQYVSVESEIDGIRISRPFSIASPPDESRRGNYYDLTVRSMDDGFLAPWIFENWKPGTPVLTSDPQGFFTYEPLRDQKTVVCLAGGSGITPFRALIPDLLIHQPDVRIILLYGATSPQELIFDTAWRQLAADDAFRFLYEPVVSRDRTGWHGETGFLTGDRISALVQHPENASFFVCGPPAMHEFLHGELGTLGLKPRQVRRESFGLGMRTVDSGTPATLTVHIEGMPHPVTVAANPAETVLTALERAGLNPPALCRSGECGWCRSRLLSGRVYVPEHSGLRAADEKFGYFHPCSSWPQSDLEIRIPRNPKQRDWRKRW